MTKERRIINDRLSVKKNYKENESKRGRCIRKRKVVIMMLGYVCMRVRE